MHALKKSHFWASSRDRSHMPPYNNIVVYVFFIDTCGLTREFVRDRGDNTVPTYRSMLSHSFKLLPCSFVNRLHLEHGHLTLLVICTTLHQESLHTQTRTREFVTCGVCL